MNGDIEPDTVNFLFNLNFFKMRKTILFAAMAAVAAGFASCSNDDSVIESQAIGKVQKEMMGFVANSNRQAGTRGTEVTTANANTMVPSFQVWAYGAAANGASATVAPGIDYMGAAGTLVSRNASGEYFPASPVYWPEAASKLDFQAIAPATDASYQSGSPALTLDDTKKYGRLQATVVIPSAVADQKDIIFAKADAKNTDVAGVTDGKVALTFDHALSQVLFSARVASASISATINSVAVCQVENKGTVGYITANGDKYDLGVSLPVEAQKGWQAEFPIGLNASPVALTSTSAVNITAENGALMMLPQTVSAWTTAAGAAVPLTTAQTNHNSYLKIHCTVTDLGSGTNIINDQDIYIPLAVNWAQGNKYTYTLVFGEGEGAFDENGDPIVTRVPIGFTMTVNAWNAVDGGEIAF